MKNMEERNDSVNNFESTRPDKGDQGTGEAGNETVEAVDTMPAGEMEAGPDERVTADEAVGEAEQVETPPDPETVIAALTAERDLLKDQLLRLRADFDNFRKRVLRETEALRATAARETIRNLLPVRDNLERALAHDPADGAAFAEGVRMILRQFDDTLAAQGLESIETDGQEFDPNVHEALTYAPSDTVPAGRIATVYERGYRIGGVLLRPAKVVVSSGPPGGGGSVTGDGTDEKNDPATNLKTETRSEQTEN